MCQPKSMTFEYNKVVYNTVNANNTITLWKCTLTTRLWLINVITYYKNAPNVLTKN